MRSDWWSQRAKNYVPSRNFIKMTVALILWREMCNVHFWHRNIILKTNIWKYSNNNSFNFLGRNPLFSFVFTCFIQGCLFSRGTNAVKFSFVFSCNKLQIYVIWTAIFLHRKIIYQYFCLKKSFQIYIYNRTYFYSNLTFSIRLLISSKIILYYNLRLHLYYPKSKLAL